MNIYREVISKRLKRFEKKLLEIENQPEGVATAVDKRKFIELKAKISELETILDIADSMIEMEDGNGTVQQKNS